jgi:hypothetical protein
MLPIKYIIRRAILGIVIVPATAVIYFVGYALLVGAGATPTSTAPEVWNNGLGFGIYLTLILMFWELIGKAYDKFNNFLDRVAGI